MPSLSVPSNMIRLMPLLSVPRLTIAADRLELQTNQSWGSRRINMQAADYGFFIIQYNHDD